MRETPNDLSDPYIIQTPGVDVWSVGRKRITHHRDVDALDPYDRGAGIAMAPIDEIDADEQAARMMANVFRNRAVPNIYLSPKLENYTSTAEQVAQLKLEDQQNAGAPNAEHTIFFQAPLTPPSRLKFLVRSLIRTEKIDTAEYLDAITFIDPFLRFFQNVYQNHLTALYDRDETVLYDSPFPEDRELKLRATQTRPDALSLNEWREISGLRPLSDEQGDAHPLQSRAVYNMSLAQAQSAQIGSSMMAAKSCGCGHCGGGGSTRNQRVDA